MPINFKEWINPFSNQFDAQAHFKKLKTSDKIRIGLVTTITAVATFWLAGIPAMALFRLLVERSYKPLNPQSLSPNTTEKKVHQIVDPIISTIPNLNNSTALASSQKVGKSAVPNNPILSKIEHAQIDLERKKRNNPYCIANHYDLTKPRNNYERYHRTDAFFQALKNNRTNEITTYLKNPHFHGLNKYYTHIHVNVGEQSTTNMSSTPLQFAIYLKNFSVFSIILESKNLDINSTVDANAKPTALSLACSLGKEGEPFIRALIAKKVDPNLKVDVYNKTLGKHELLTALQIAMKNGVSPELIQELQSYEKINEVDMFGETKLHQAILKGNLTAFETAIADGVAIDSRTNAGEGALHLAVRHMEKDPFIAKQMITILIQKGAYLDVTDIHGRTPFYQLCDIGIRNQIYGWEDVALLLLQQGANFSKATNNNSTAAIAFFKYPDSHPIKDYLLKNSKGEFEEYQNRKTLSTILGITFIGFSINTVSGGNYQAPLSEILDESFNHFIEDESLFIDPKMIYIFKDLKSSVNFAKKIATTLNPDDLFEEVKTNMNHFPVIIPSGWTDANSHATSIVIYKKKIIFCNRGLQYDLSGTYLKKEFEKPGLGIYEFDVSSFNKETFKKMANCKLTRDRYLSEIVTELRAIPVKHIELKGQKHGNCSWSSCVSLGLRAAVMVAQNKDQESTDLSIKDSANQIKKVFHHYTKWFLVKKYIDQMINHLETRPFDYSPEIFADVSKKLLKKIQDKKDPYGYYKKILDEITFSGIVFKGCSYKFSQEQKQFYASLYGQNPNSFFELIAPETKVGDWEWARS